jgi:aldehyde dehydrogenase family 7 protein A1
MATEKAKW